MRALVKTNAAPGLEMQDIPIPEVGPNDVLIKIKKTAICGTDLHIFAWDEWAAAHIKPPLTIGHEFMGEVVATGKEVQSYFKIGDRVSGEGHIACKHCRNCRAGRAHLCRSNVSIGVTRDGCFAEYLVLPAINTFVIPPSIPDEVASIFDPFGNAVHTALSFDLVGEDVLITGAGPVGLMAASVAKHVGARHVVITDVNEYRLNIAREMKIAHAVNPTQESLAKVMARLGMKEGFDVALEMSGNSAAFNAMLDVMNHAGKISLLGFLPTKTTIDWSQVIMKGLILKGIYGREMFDTWYKMIGLLQSGLNIRPIITHTFDANDYLDAFATLQTGKSAKIILNW